MAAEIPVKEYTDDRLYQTEPILTQKTENGFKCPNCGSEVIVGRERASDGTKMPQIYNCQVCNKKWEILLRSGQVTKF